MIPSPIKDRITESARTELALIIEAFLGRENSFHNRAMVQRRCREWGDSLVRDGLIRDYSIVCGEQNNPPSNLEYGMRVDVMLQPTRTIEFLTFPIMIGSAFD